jgi:hypothetical protein
MEKMKRKIVYLPEGEGILMLGSLLGKSSVEQSDKSLDPRA